MADTMSKYAKFAAPAGAFSPWSRVLISGPAKSGKSRFLAGMPGPRIVIDSGEQGIGMYLGKEDQLYLISDPLMMVEAFADAVATIRAGAKFQTIILDSYTLFWDGVLDGARAKLGEGTDPTFKDWGWIKKPNARLVKLAMGAPCNIGLSAWLKDLEAVQAEAPKGIRPKIELRKVSKAKVEKSIPYFFDYWFEADQTLDQEGHPTGEHTIEFVAGRIPPSCPPDKLRPGQVWRFRADQPKSPAEVWQDVAGWLTEYRAQGGTPMMVGLDAQEEQDVWARYQADASSETLGGMIRAMRSASTAPEYRRLFMTRLQSEATSLSEDDKRMFSELHELRKKELGV